jgi:protein TonB
MIMTPFLRGAMLLCTLPLAVCMTTALTPQGQVSETSPLEASAAAAQSRPAETFKAWTLQVTRHIASKKRYPAASIARREQGSVVVAFTIDRQGGLVRSRISRSSGFAALDNAALELVRQAQPFPPPPAGLSVPHINLTLPISYTFGRCGPLDRLFGRCA